MLLEHTPIEGPRELGLLSVGKTWVILDGDSIGLNQNSEYGHIVMEDLMNDC